MSLYKQTGSLKIGKGVYLTFHIDDSKPKDSLDYHYAQVSYDGEPDSDVFEVPPHWHKLHDEHMSVIQGRVEFSMDGKSYVRSPDDETLIIPRRHVHGIKFFRGEAAVIQERTTPVDEGVRKEAFFEDMLDGGGMSLSSACRAAYAGDTVLGFSGIKIVDEVLRFVLGALFTWMYPVKARGKLPDGLLGAR